MKQVEKSSDKHSTGEARQRRLVGMHLQSIEDNPLDAVQTAIFEMFECEGWSHERRRAYLLERARAAHRVPAAE